MNKKMPTEHTEDTEKKLADGEQEKRFFGFEMMFVLWEKPRAVQRGCAVLRRGFCVFCVFCGLNK